MSSHLNSNVSIYSLVLWLQDWVINYFISNGAPPEKLILGIAFYGKSFIWNSDARMIGGPAKYGDFVGYKAVGAKFYII